MVQYMDDSYVQAVSSHPQPTPPPTIHPSVSIIHPPAAASKKCLPNAPPPPPPAAAAARAGVAVDARRWRPRRGRRT